MPKANHVGLSTLCFGVYDAISHFNYGQKAAFDIFKELDVEPGVYMRKSCGFINRKRKSHSVYKAKAPQLKRRKILRHSSKKRSDKKLSLEGNTYEAGGF